MGDRDACRTVLQALGLHNPPPASPTPAPAAAPARSSGQWVLVADIAAEHGTGIYGAIRRGQVAATRRDGRTAWVRADDAAAWLRGRPCNDAVPAGLLGLVAAAELHGLSEHTLRNAAAKGRVRAVKARGKWWFDPDVVAAYAARVGRA